MKIDYAQTQPALQKFKKLLIRLIAGDMPVMMNLKLSHGEKETGLTLKGVINGLFLNVEIDCGPTRTGFRFTGIDPIKELNK